MAPFLQQNLMQRRPVLGSGRTGTVNRRVLQRVRYSDGPEPPYTPLESYMVLGLSHCFEKNEDGKLVDRHVLEPICATSLESMAVGARTSFKHVVGLTLQAALQRDRSKLPEAFQTGVYCRNYGIRCEAAARTWNRPHPQENLLDLVPLGQVRSDWNFDINDKRVLNLAHIVNDDDNIKQDLSIDAYGRKQKQEEEDKAKKEAAQAKLEAERRKKEEEDDLDALLLS